MRVRKAAHEEPALECCISAKGTICQLYCPQQLFTTQFDVTHGSCWMVGESDAKTVAGSCIASVGEARQQLATGWGERLILRISQGYSRNERSLGANRVHLTACECCCKKVLTCEQLQYMLDEVCVQNVK